jgi:iron-sulfur cluster repair protein YtfE (RIC family)
MTMTPSELRTRILAEHDRLRGLLDRVEATAARVLGGEEDAAPLRDQARSLAHDMALHIAAEEETLAVVLLGIDAWGPVRVAQMHADHTEQLAALRRIADEAGETPTSPDVLAVDVRRLVSDIRHDMLREEDDLLHPDLLRDDVVDIDQSDG